MYRYPGQLRYEEGIDTCQELLGIPEASASEPHNELHVVIRHSWDSKHSRQGSGGRGSCAGDLGSEQQISNRSEKKEVTLCKLLYSPNTLDTILIMFRSVTEGHVEAKRTPETKRGEPCR